MSYQRWRFMGHGEGVVEAGRGREEKRLGGARRAGRSTLLGLRIYGSPRTGGKTAGVGESVGEANPNADFASV